MKSSDQVFQKRSFSSKIKDNGVHILTIGDMEAKSVLQFPISSSSTPAGTDESICEFLVSLEENAPHIGSTSVSDPTLFFT